MSQSIDQNSWISHTTKGPSSVFAILFGISFVLHVYQSRKYDCWIFTWQLPCGSILAIAALICLEISAFHHDIDNSSAVIGLFYSSALTFALPTFSTLFRLLLVSPTVIRIPQGYAFAFISSFNTAIITCLAQGAATYFSPEQSDRAIVSGRRLLQASLLLFLFLNAVFFALLALWQYRQTTRYRSELIGSARVRVLVRTLYLLQGLIVVRNVFRTVQIFASPASAAWMREGYFWVFEVLMLVLFNLVWHLRHPARYVPMDRASLGRDGAACRGLVRRNSDGSEAEHGRAPANEPGNGRG